MKGKTIKTNSPIRQRFCQSYSFSPFGGGRKACGSMAVHFNGKCPFGTMFRKLFRHRNNELPSVVEVEHGHVRGLTKFQDVVAIVFGIRWRNYRRILFAPKVVLTKYEMR